MRSLLVSPNHPNYRKDTDYLFPNLGLCSIKTNSSVEIQILDAVVDNLSIKETIEKISIVNPMVVGFYTTYLNLPYVLEICHKLKEKNLEIITVIGGPGAKSLKVLAKSGNINCVNYVILGDGEKIFEQICLKRELPEFTKYLIGEIDIERIKFPERDEDDLEKSLFHNLKHTFLKKRTTNIFTAKGCDWGKCIFCSVDKRIRFRPISQIKDELEYLRDFNVEHLYVGNDSFLVNRDRVREFCKAMKKFNYTWHVQLRVMDLIGNKESLKLLQLMKDSGCIWVAVGFESGNSEILRILNKGIGAEDNYRALKLLSQIKIPIQVLLMYNNPHESLRSLQDTYKFLEKAIETLEVKRVTLGEFASIPGTSAWERNLKGDLKVEIKRGFEQKIIDLCKKYSVASFFTHYQSDSKKILSHIEK